MHEFPEQIHVYLKSTTSNSNAIITTTTTTAMTGNKVAMVGESSTKTNVQEGEHALIQCNKPLALQIKEEKVHQGKIIYIGNVNITRTEFKTSEFDDINPFFMNVYL